VALEGSKIFLPYEYAMDPELAGIYVIFDDGVLLQLGVRGSNDFYEVSWYLDEWFCEPCPSFHFRGRCSHVDRGRKFIMKRGVLNDC
jgi:hypothetical protein